MKSRSIRWWFFPLQLIASFALALALGSLDDEAHALGDLLRFENVPILMCLTFLFFTVMATATLAVFDRHAAEVRAKEEERRSAR